MREPVRHHKNPVRWFKGEFKEPATMLKSTYRLIQNWTQSTREEGNQLHFQGTKFICMSMDKNHLHNCQLPRIYRIVKELKVNERQRGLTQPSHLEDYSDDPHCLVFHWRQLVRSFCPFQSLLRFFLCLHMFSCNCNIFFRDTDCNFRKSNWSVTSSSNSFHKPAWNICGRPLGCVGKVRERRCFTMGRQADLLRENGDGRALGKGLVT